MVVGPVDVQYFTDIDFRYGQHNFKFDVKPLHVCPECVAPEGTVQEAQTLWAYSLHCRFGLAVKFVLISFSVFIGAAMAISGSATS